MLCKNYNSGVPGEGTSSSSTTERVEGSGVNHLFIKNTAQSKNPLIH